MDADARARAAVAATADALLKRHASRPLDEKMGAKQYKKVGFGNHRFLDKDGAQCHIAWDSDHMIIAFRGTEPDQMSDVKADLLAIKRKSKTEGRVHLGFKLELTRAGSSLSSSSSKRACWFRVSVRLRVRVGVKGSVSGLG